MERSKMTNVLFILCDALRPTNLREWGYHKDTAPNITKLCDNATVYRNVYSQFNYTTASMATILTGEYYTKHGIWRLFYPPYDEDKARQAVMFGQPHWKWKLHSPTIAEKLNDTHKTIMINEIFVDLTDQGGLLWDKFDVAPSNYSGQKGMTIHPKSNIPVHPTAEQTADEALKYITDDEPFFMYVHFWSTHWPPSAPKDYLDEFYDGTNPESLHKMFGPKVTPDARRMVREQIAARTEKRDLSYMKAWYDAEIKYMDEHIGRLIDAVPEDTLIIITSDHGEAMGEHNGVYFAHVECWMYNEVLHVPLIVKYPTRRKYLLKDDGESLFDGYKFHGRRTFYNRVENRKIHDIILNWVNHQSDKQIVQDYVYSATKASEDFTPHIDVLIKDDLKLFVHDFGSETYGFNLKDDPKELNPLLVHDRPEFDELKKIIMQYVEAELPKPEGAV